MSIIGYCRISTKKQILGNGLKAQRKEILEKYENAEIFEEQYTGKTKDRPVFQEILKNKLKSGDTLVVNKLDRLARNTVEGIEIIQDLFNRNIAVHALNVGLLENTYMGKFFITTLLAVAEMERNMIIERTQAGKEIAKQNPGFKEGRPKKYSNSKLDLAMDLIKKHSYRQVVKMTGISLSTIQREVNQRKK